MAETLRWWVQEWHGLKDAFAAKYPSPFLLQLAISESSGDEGDPAKHFMTLKVGRSSHTRADPLELPLYPVVKGANNAFGMMITVGRAANNDIVIEASSISKFHAYLEHREEGWKLRDANSSNGTYVGPVEVTTDASVDLPDNSVIKFARVSCRFLLPETFDGLLAKEAARLVRRGEL